MDNSRFVKSADGTEICADAMGNRSPGTPVLVLIHGAYMRKEAFNPMFEDPKWTSDFYMVRYDTRSHGRSTMSVAEEAWESKRFSDDFEAVCKEFNVTEAYLLGWSVGSAQFADIMTYNTSVRVLGVINVAGVAYLDFQVSLRVVTQVVYETSATIVSPASVGAFQESVFKFLSICSDRLSPDLFRILLEGLLRQPRAVAALVVKRVQSGEKLMEEARAGRLPLLAVSGGKDQALNVDGFKVVFDDLGWKKVTYKHLEEADHIPWVSCPEEFRETVTAWIKELRA